MQQIFPRMKHPYITYKAYSDKPFGFACGSREELELITHCICHANESLFTDVPEQAGITVEYRSTTPCRKNNIRQTSGFKGVYKQEISGFQSRTSIHVTKDAERLFTLAFARNKFHDATWGYVEYRINHDDEYNQRTEKADRTYTRTRYDLDPAKILVHVAPPSAHERAESLLVLWDWLDGKISGKERQQLLGLEEADI